VCKRLRIYLLPVLLLLSICLLSLPLPASAAESTISEAKTYTITEYQLTQLEERLSRLAINNETLAADCKALEAQLEVSQATLEEAKRESEQLKTQLAKLTLQSKSSETLLQTANESLEKYAKEQQRTQARLKWQRNIAWGLLGCVLVAGLT
jgi:chromosome segregation ATPase